MAPISRSTPLDDLPVAMKLKEVAAFMGVATSTVRAWVARGLLKPDGDPGTRPRIHRDELKRFLGARAEA